MAQDVWTAVEGRRRRGWFWSENGVFDLKVSAYAKLTYLYLCRRADNVARESYPGLETMAGDLGISVNTVRRALVELRQAGAVKIQTGNGVGHPSRYQVQDLERVSVGDPSTPETPERVSVGDPSRVAVRNAKGGCGDTEGRPTEGRPKNKEDSKDSATPGGAAAWTGYELANQVRYGIPPVRNAKVNAILAGLVKRIPADEAGDVAAFYVRHNAALYVRAGHSVDLLLRDAEKLRTEWKTGNRMTDRTARDLDGRQAQGDIAQRLLDKADRQAAGHA